MSGIEKWGLKLPLALKNNSLWKHCQSDTWGRNIYVTLDFSRVAKQGTTGGSNKTETSEQILRPLHWFVSVYLQENDHGKVVLLLLSPYEANYFLPIFRTGTAKGILHSFAPRLSPDQDTLYRNSSLWIPCQKAAFGDQLLDHLFPGSLNSALLLFSGSSYFKDEREQNAYCAFLGFCLRPRTEEEEAVFTAGGIVNGFLKSGPWRNALGYNECRFGENPEALIRGIIEKRYGSFPVEAHVGKMIFHCVKPLTKAESGKRNIESEVLPILILRSLN
jgi:hypothetical protein